MFLVSFSCAYQPWLISILAVVVVGDISEFALMLYNM
jgi:hypothetical protein